MYTAKMNLGGKIYALRTSNRMSQTQLGEVLGVTSAAISKWERNLALPDVGMLCEIADYFDCSLDELTGRSKGQISGIGVYDDRMARMAETADDLMECCKLARSKGLLALDGVAGRRRVQEGIQGGQGQVWQGRQTEQGRQPQTEIQGGQSRQSRQESGDFLAFSIDFLLTGYIHRHMGIDIIHYLLNNYAKTLPDEEMREGEMIADILCRIAEGECEEMLSEYISSYIGTEYYRKKETVGVQWSSAVYRELTREELIDRYRDKRQYSEATGLLDVFCGVGDFEIQMILKSIDSKTFTMAMQGCQGNTAVRFLANLSDRMLKLICEDMDNCQASEEEIVSAQIRMLEAGAFAIAGK